MRQEVAVKGKVKKDQFKWKREGDLRLDPAYGRRVSVRAGVGTFLLLSKGFFLLLLRRLPLSALSELWIGAIIQGGFLAWRDDALAWRPWREKIGLHVRVVVPGDGGYHRSVVAGFSPGGGGSFSSADAGSSSREGSGSGSGRRCSRFDDEALRRGEVGQVNNQVVSAEVQRVSELRRNERSGDLFWFLPESMKGKLRRRNACRSEWCRSSHVSLPLLPCFSHRP
ncbi:hypothetical protein DY000_02045956 [Brassica cretica]|uniref:Uncharacterized protein n=1 Tax=Brassica cretica TaxID=69181 RepID=A0ABQ7F759_BRACR|nr:hypothetical protein DY000_02045956 [Brassica cretica]